MKARLFGVDARQPGSHAALNNTARLLARVHDLRRWTACTGLRVAADRRLFYIDIRILQDIGLRRDDFPGVVRERLQERVMRYHI